ncbi:hypothetical protein AKJ09_09204 [Labilithrix luteola]|uniref:Uncharacterized protein n=1 Tax=Labilithrix luteola TaxID=1391654 RepID=A0A0K1Q9S2_9BACT|nr:hypothetical protein AKJ09_09204 [Labilithrix luteola]
MAFSQVRSRSAAACWIFVFVGARVERGLEEDEDPARDEPAEGALSPGARARKL